MKAVVSLSGGMDSTTVLAEAVLKHGKDSVMAVGFNYGSKHNPVEIACARLVADYYGVAFRLVDFSAVTKDFSSNLLSSGGDIPTGHYHEETMRQTVVPGRNLIFISILTGLAWSVGAKEIWLGIHAGDHFIYPDCRPTFFHAMNAAVNAGSDEKVELVAPFLHGDKTTIIRRGQNLGVPYLLTRTCYTSDTIACGKCGSCQERLEAFAANNMEDPIPYVTREILAKA